MNLRDNWEAHAQQWIQWARTPGGDNYWQGHRDEFLKLLPAPGRATLDIGCGEGRLARDLKRLGHRMIAIDGSSSLVAAAREADPSMDIRVADAAALPLADGSVDLAVAYMSLHAIDAMPAAIKEAARVLDPGGHFCMAIVHPFVSAGYLLEGSRDPASVEGYYVREFPYTVAIKRGDMTMMLCGRHRPLENFFSALEQAGFLTEALREPSYPDHAAASGSDRGKHRPPPFLHLRARRRRR